MKETTILIEVPKEDKDLAIKSLKQIDAKIIDEFEVDRLDGMETFQLIVEISGVVIGAISLIKDFLSKKNVKIKKNGIEYEGPFDEDTINEIFGDDISEK